MLSDVIAIDDRYDRRTLRPEQIEQFPQFADETIDTFAWVCREDSARSKL
jgi:hypothetical protein